MIYSVSDMTTSHWTILEDRAAITLKGADSRDFLQGLVTQDLEALGRRMLYGAMLTPQGKMDHDFFISQDGDALVLECDAARSEALAKKLMTYKLRRAVEITVHPVRVLQSWNGVVAGYADDPRPLVNASRGILKETPAGTDAGNDAYYIACIEKRIPSGSRDIAWGEDTVADIDLEYLNGVSFTKGCYMGQELTSRMHHRGLSKKALYTVQIVGDSLPAFTDIVYDGNLVGEMRSSVKGIGLAMLRKDSLDKAALAGFATGT